MLLQIFLVFGLMALTLGAATSSDVRSDLLFLGQLVRENVDKLERHEFRERQLGDNLMRSLAGMDRRLSTMERAAEDRAKRIEAVVKEVRKDVQAQFEKVLEALASRSEVATAPAPVLVSAPPTDCVKEQRLDAVFVNVTQRLNLLVQALPEIRQETHGALELCTDARQILPNVLKVTEDLQFALQSTNEKTLSEIRESATSSKASTAEIVKSLETVLQTAASSGSRENSNQTENIIRSLDRVLQLIDELSDSVKQSHDGILKEVHQFGGVEQVLVRTADNVLDAKKTIEYSVHQIRAEVGEMVRQQSRELNTTLNSRFDAISTDIMTQQSGNAANLSSKIETEISQVWRQIGIMYQQLSSSAEMLQRLQQQTEAYVNGSLKTIGGMEGKVGQITGQMGQVDDNLQFLLGRLSLVTQEFNAVKSSVGATLDGLRSGFVDVQNSIKDTGPGPNPLPDNYPAVEAADAADDD